MSIFGLTGCQLRPVIDSIVTDEEIASFNVTIKHQVKGHYGYSAEKIIPTFNYRTQTGHRGKVPVLVKRFYEPGSKEAFHYAHLEKLHAPIPRMYGSLGDKEGREILFLEYLDPAKDIYPFSEFLMDADRLCQFLTVAARFNALRPCGEYAARLPRHDVAKRLKAVVPILGSLWGHACKGELGEAMEHLCLDSLDKLPHLQMLANSLARNVTEMETGLVHFDLYPDSVGWRRQTGELLVLDLEMVGFAPRFYDVAHWLGLPDEVQPRCLPRVKLARHYLEEYVRCGGTAVSLERFLEEISVLWIVQTLSMLWFRLDRALDGRVDWTKDVTEGRCVYRAELLKDLAFLLREV